MSKFQNFLLLFIWALLLSNVQPLPFENQIKILKRSGNDFNQDQEFYQSLKGQKKKIKKKTVATISQLQPTDPIDELFDDSEYDTDFENEAQYSSDSESDLSDSDSETSDSSSDSDSDSSSSDQSDGSTSDDSETYSETDSDDSDSSDDSGAESESETEDSNSEGSGLGYESETQEPVIVSKEKMTEYIHERTNFPTFALLNMKPELLNRLYNYAKVQVNVLPYKRNHKLYIIGLNDEKRIEKIKVAYLDAIQNAKRIIQEFKVKRDQSPYFQKYFKNGDFLKVLRIYQKIIKLQNIFITFYEPKVSDPWPIRISEARTISYDKENGIGLLEINLIASRANNFFYKTRMERASTILHELTHLFGTEDICYGKEICKMFSKKPEDFSDERIINERILQVDDNADSYARAADALKVDQQLMRQPSISDDEHDFNE